MAAEYSARPELNRSTLLWAYEKLVTIRRFEEQARREADAGKLRGMHSSIGQEAVPTGVCAHLWDNDFVLGTHRSHHHCIAKGVDLNEMMAELLGKATGTNKGKGGTMHIADIDKGMLGANGVVGSNIPVATGVALSASVRGSDQVSVVFFGDGASSQGSLHESMNLASIWKLPILFVCENNRYAEATPFEYSVAGASISKRAAGYDMPGVTVDGQSLPDVYAAAGEAVRRARAGEGADPHRGADIPLPGSLWGRQPSRVQDRRRGSVLPRQGLHRQAQGARAGRGIRNGGRVVRHRRERGRRGRRGDQVRRREPVPG